MTDKPTAKPLVIDDRDASVRYSAGWGKAGSILTEHDGTTSFATKDGLTAEVTFSGTRIRVYGTVPTDGDAPLIKSTYSIDGSTPLEFTAAATKRTQYDHLFYQSPDLPGNVPHVLKITHQGDKGVLYLDYFEVETSELTTATTSQSSTTTSSSTTSTSTTTSQTSTSTVDPKTVVVVVDPTPISDPNGAKPPDGALSDQTTAAASKSNSGVIAGAVFGGVVLVMILTGIWIVIMKRRRRRRLSLAAANMFANHDEKMWNRQP
jgi:hypothetical protein